MFNHPHTTKYHLFFDLRLLGDKTLLCITQNDFLISQNNLRQTQTVLDGLKKKKQILGVMSNGRLDIPAPIHGVVYGIDTHIGELVDPSDQKVLMKIADPTKKILVASVYEKELPNFHKNASNHSFHLSDQLTPESGCSAGFSGATAV